MAKQETQTKIDIAVLKENQIMNTKEHQDIKDTLEDIKIAITGLDTKFSAKWVEKGVTAIIVALVLGAVYAVANNAGIPIK